MDNYHKVFINQYIGYGFLNTLTRLVIGSPLTLIVTIMAAYPLSKRNLPNRAFWTGFFVFTMFFSGGMIPDYLVVRQVGIYNTPWALVLPRLVDTFNLLIMRNYMMSLPESLEESAKIDGASDLTVLSRIILPLSLPIIATVGLWTMVNHWSWWFDSLLYIKDAKGMVLQVVMRRIVLEGTMQMMDQSGFQDETMVNADGLKAAVIMVTTIPIVCVYPFLQKYFVKGILVGSLKG
jgi:putative aldouronate transport system permease protein